MGLVTFNNEVQLIGDGAKAAVTIAGDRLNDYEAIVNLVGQNSALLSQPIEKTAKVLNIHTSHPIVVPLV